jgi:SAM-dependent methyltransferase
VSLKRIFYPESRFGGFTDIDGTIAFYLRLNSLIEPWHVILDYGCGRGAYGADPVPVRRALHVLRGKASKVIGVDVDEAARTNPFLDEFRHLTGARWPVDDDSIDLCVCDSVLEHLEEPEPFFAEARRCLRDGGFLCVRTPNRWSYVGIIAGIVPNRLHSRVLAKAQRARHEEDVFPTYYKCNTLHRIRHMLSRYGFDHVTYGHEAAPSYLSFSRLAYMLGVVHQRLAPSFARAAIFSFAQVSKPQGLHRVDGPERVRGENLE